MTVLAFSRVGSIWISNRSGFPCLHPDCVVKINPVDGTVEALQAARILRDAHVKDAHPDFVPGVPAPVYTRRQVELARKDALRSQR